MFFSDIHTLHEFVTSTKALSYLIALFYLAAFPAFYKFLVARDEQRNDIGRK